MINQQARIKAAQEEVDKNYEYFKKNIDEITPKSNGKKFVLLHKQKQIGYFQTIDDAEEAGNLLYKDKDLPFSIQEIGELDVDLGFQSYAVL